ncbi:PREDICTED: hemicentin-2-like [Branchiostoma belcheri]|uniref:Hemicentin-2-like n=1 Tax=Branchiostoma belcheri TaxID=7741 RepID=A0A6P5AME7_BRABE|nr:PREDICTED: hemicentin-2-like [Branchiostoma belcheri]
MNKDDAIAQWVSIVTNADKSHQDEPTDLWGTQGVRRIDHPCRTRWWSDSTYANTPVSCRIWAGASQTSGASVYKLGPLSRLLWRVSRGNFWRTGTTVRRNMPAATDSVVWAVFLVLALSVVLKVDGASYRERPKSADVLKGDTVTLHCTIDGLPPSEMVQWYGPPDMRHISSGNVIAKRFKGRYRILGDTSRGEHNLQILRAANSDEGEYRCSTLSLDETADATLTVVVPLSGPPDIIGDTAPRKAGQGLMLTCTSVGGRPPPRLTWYNGTRPYKLPDDAFKEGINKGEVMLNLVIPYLTKWDNGANLSCKADQGFPSLVKPRTAVKVLNVRYPPTVTVTPKSSRVMEGESLNVTCHVDSNPPADVDWRKVGHALPFRVDNRGQVLHLDRVSSSDAGIYQCIAENGIPPDGYGTFTLEVLFTPRIRQTFDTKVSVLYGQDGFSLECVAEGNPRPQVRWRRQNTELYMGNPLVLSPVNYDVEGKYACVASSPGFASVDKETFIDVVGKGM